MKGLLFIAGAIVFVLGAYLLIDSALAISRVIPFLLDINNPLIFPGNDIPPLLAFTQALHEALLGIGAVLVAFIFVVSGFAVQLIQDRAELEEKRQKELLAEQYPDKIP